MITTAQFKTLDDLYGFYNNALFGGLLPECIVNMSRHNGTYGFFSAGRWKSTGDGTARLVHEISLNPDYLDRPFAGWHSTLVHEMAHLWQEDFGRPSRNGYHNREWGRKMEELGLVPSDTGKEGGKKTGQSVSHYILPDGPFMNEFNRLSRDALEALRLKYLPAYGIGVTKPSGLRKGTEGGPDSDGTSPDAGGVIETIEKYNSKSKYSCPCGSNIWGRPGLHIICGDCSGTFSPA
jgi:hypothetical protein